MGRSDAVGSAVQSGTIEREIGKAGSRNHRAGVCGKRGAERWGIGWKIDQISNSKKQNYILKFKKKTVIFWIDRDGCPVYSGL